MSPSENKVIIIIIIIIIIVDYAKKNYVLPTILSTELRGQYNRFLH